MIVTMQFELMNSTSVDDVYGYLYGLLGNFPDYSHLICIRDDIEDITDYSTLIDSFQVKLNKGFLPEGDYKSFKASDIVPGYEQIFEAAEPGEMFFVKLIHNMDNIYGFYAVKSSSLSSNDLRFMGQLSESATLVIESILRNHRLELANKKLNEMYEKMSDIYIKDALTGLYNRHGYYKSLDEYLADSEIKEGYIHLISIDMDKMKYINDNFGHLEGDVAIKAVADAIRNCFAPPCVYARFGGDEFLVALFSPDEEMTSLEEISERLNDTLEKTVELADKKYRVGVSVGKASAKISELKDFKELEKLADECMYENKKMRKREI